MLRRLDVFNALDIIDIHDLLYVYLEKMMDAGKLPLEDRVSLWIGRVCRADVMLEVHLRQLWSFSTNRRDAPRDMGRLLDACDVLPQRIEWMLELAYDAAAVFTAARTAHLERNRLVHDAWVRLSEDELVWQRASDGVLPERSDSSTRDLAQFEDCLHQLARASVRIYGLRSFMRTPFPNDPAHPLDWYAAVMRGEFRLLDGNRIETADPELDRRRAEYFENLKP